jgi:hypothetical protein
MRLRVFVSVPILGKRCLYAGAAPNEESRAALEIVCGLVRQLSRSSSSICPFDGLTTVTALGRLRRHPHPALPLPEHPSLRSGQALSGKGRFPRHLGGRNCCERTRQLSFDALLSYTIVER